MRISIALLLFALCFGCAPVAAQHTFDVKYPIYSSSGADYGGLLRITPSKIIANGNDSRRKPIIILLNNDGMIMKQLKLDYPLSYSMFYSYYPDSNQIVAIVHDDLFRLHFLHIDTNLNLESDTIIDSTIINVPPQYKYMGRPKSIRLHDSTIIISLYYAIDAVSKDNKRIVLHLTKEGGYINYYQFHSADSYSNFPMFQLPTNKILWRTGYYDNNVFHTCFRLSTDKFSFDTTKYLVDLGVNPISYDYKSVISTSDSGIASVRLQGVWPNITTQLIKFDARMQQQWEITVPGVESDAVQLLESKNGGYYVVTQTHSDTSTGIYRDCYRDIAVSRIDAAGYYIFTAYYGSGYCTQFPASSIQDNDGGIIISGRYNRKGSDGLCDFTCNEQDSTWIFKVDTLGRPTKKVTGVEESSGALSIRLYPNPSSSELTVEFGRVDFYNSIEIIDNNAQVVQAIPINNISQAFTTLDISSLASGNYFCRLRSQAGSITRPFIIQRS